MDRDFEIQGEQMICCMPSEIDHHRSMPLARKVDGLIGSNNIKKLIFDFANTTFMDSSGIGFLIGRSRTMHFYGGKIAARNLGGRAAKLFMASGLDQIIELEEGCDE